MTAAAWPAGRPETLEQFVAQLRPDDTDAWLGPLERFRVSGDLLYTGIGAGRRAVELALAGWRVHGVEPDPAPLRELRRRLDCDERIAGARDRLVVEQARVEDSAAPGPFDAVLLPDLVLCLTLDPDGQREVLAACAKRCRPTGMVFADVVNPGPFLAASLGGAPLGDLDAAVPVQVGYEPALRGGVLEIAGSDAAAQRFDVVARYRLTYPDGDVREFADPHALRWLSPHELALLARDAGLGVAGGSFAMAELPVWRVAFRPL